MPRCYCCVAAVLLLFRCWSAPRAGCRDAQGGAVAWTAAAVPGSEATRALQLPVKHSNDKQEEEVRT